jgi:hypothetical protein
VRLYEDNGLNEKEVETLRVSFVEVPFSDIFIKYASGTFRRFNIPNNTGIRQKASDEKVYSSLGIWAL